MGHIGLYAFRMGALERFVSLPRVIRWKAGKAGALRFLENGVPIRVVRVEGYEATAWTRRKIWKSSASCSRSTPAKAASVNTGAYATLTNATAGLPPRFNITETE